MVIIMEMEEGKGLYEFLDSNKVTMEAESELLENLQELFKDFWMDNAPKRETKNFDLSIQEGWYDEKEDRWVFTAKIGNIAIVGLNGLRWYINNGNTIGDITYNGIEVRKDQQEKFINEVIFHRGDEE